MPGTRRLLLLAWLLLQSTAWAQDINSLPPCVLTLCAITAATEAGCSVTDSPCICKGRSFRSQTLKCASQLCEREDASLAAGVLSEICDSLTTSPVSPGSSSSTTSRSIFSRPPITTQNPSANPSTPTISPTVTDTSDGQPSQETSPTTSPSVVTVTTGIPTTVTATTPTPESTTTVVSTSTASLSPTGNAALGLAGQNFGTFGAMVMGLLAFV